MLTPPDGAFLLELARDEECRLRDPAFAGNRRYRKLLINRARDIAAREAQLGAALQRQELTALETLYGQRAMQCDDPRQRVQQLNAKLVTDLRARQLPSALESALLALLQTQVRGRLTISNPKYLQTAEENV